MDITRREERGEEGRRGEWRMEGRWGWSTEVGGGKKVAGSRPRRAELPDSQLNRNQDRPIYIRQGTKWETFCPCFLLVFLVFHGSVERTTSMLIIIISLGSFTL